ncbi:MAG: FUSC family protein [Solirubrobacterales bacterium]
MSAPDSFVAARETARDISRSRLRDLREVWLPIVQVGVAAALSYLIAQQLIGHGSPFFAPIAAVLTLGLSVGQRGRRAIELGVGVALGIGVADVLVMLIGTGVWQVGLIVALAVAAGVLAGGGTLLVNQAAVSAVLVATLPAPPGYSGARFVDALIGAAVALLANALIPSHPLRMARRELDPLLAELAGIFDQLAGALRERDRAAAAEALARGRVGERAIGAVRETLSAGVETTMMAPQRRASRGQVGDLVAAMDPIDFAWRNSRVLARNVMRSIDQGDPAPPAAVESVQMLAEAVRALDRALWDDDAIPAARHAATCAAVLAMDSLADTANLSVSGIVSQVRSIAVDLLRASGINDAEAAAFVHRAVAAAQ